MMRSIRRNLREVPCRIRRAAICLVILPAVSGCLFKNPDYPRSWPLVTITKDIEDRVEGTFKCVGETITPNGDWAIYLSDYLLSSEAGYLCEYVEIRRAAADEIQVRILQGESEGQWKSYKRGKDYDVQDGLIAIISRKGWDAAAVTPIYYSSETLYLSVDAQGDLVIREKSTGVGMTGVVIGISAAVIIPVVGSETRWARFKRKDMASEEPETVFPEYAKIDVKMLEEVFCGTNRARLCNDPFSNNKQKEWIDCEPEMKFYLIQWSGNPGYTWGKVIIHKKGKFFKGGWIENTELLTKEEWESR